MHGTDLLAAARKRRMERESKLREDEERVGKRQTSDI